MGAVIVQDLQCFNSGGKYWQMFAIRKKYESLRLFVKKWKESRQRKVKKYIRAKNLSKKVVGNCENLRTLGGLCAKCRKPKPLRVCGCGAIIARCKALYNSIVIYSRYCKGLYSAVYAESLIFALYCVWWYCAMCLYGLIANRSIQAVFGALWRVISLSPCLLSLSRCAHALNFRLCWLLAVSVM
jgi:hypothetical protein